MEEKGLGIVASRRLSVKCDRKGNRVKGSWTHCVGLVGLDLWSKPSWLLDSLITWFRLSWLLGQGLGSLGESILWSLPKTLNPLWSPSWVLGQKLDCLGESLLGPLGQWLLGSLGENLLGSLGEGLLGSLAKGFFVPLVKALVPWWLSSCSLAKAMDPLVMVFLAP